MGKTASFISLILCVVFSSCSRLPVKQAEQQSVISPSLTPSPENTKTPVPSPTITPTPDPMGDPDRDDFISLYEDAWGSDPNEYTTFEDLAQLPGSIYAKMRVSQPFDFTDMNDTIYQVARFVDIDDGGTPDNPVDDHLNFEVVLFPFVEDTLIAMEVDHFPIDPGNYPQDIQQYLISNDSDISNITEELQTTMLAIVNGTGEGYSSPARTDVEAIARIMDWNHSNLSVDPKYETYYPSYGSIIEMRAGDMFAAKLTRWCTTRAVILSAELRSIGLPVKSYHHISCVCNPNDDYENCDNRGSHIQNGVYIGGQWVIFDYNGVHPRAEPWGTNLIITDSYRDNTEADFNFWIYIIDTPRIEYPFNLLYYTFERIEN